MIQTTNIGIDDTVSEYFHILKVNNKKFIVPSSDYATIKRFNSLQKAIKYCNGKQKNKRNVILVHNSDGFVIDSFRPRLKVLSQSETTKTRNKKRPVHTRAILING